MNKNIKYCSITPSFPKNAWMITIFILSVTEEKVIGTYPLTNLSISFEEISLDIKQLTEYNKKENKIKVGEFVSILPVAFESLYPLRKEFWGNPSSHFDADDRIRLLREAATQPIFYKLLVTPNILNNIWVYSAALPFFISSNNSLIEKFMLTSDWPVTPLAKYAAIYSLGEPKKYNWITKEVSNLLNNKKIGFYN